MMKKIAILVAALVIGSSVSAMQESNVKANVELAELVEQAVEAGLVTQDEAQALVLDKKTDSSVSRSENKRKYIIAALVAAGVVATGYYLYARSKVTEAPAATEAEVTEAEVTEAEVTEVVISGRTREYLPRKAKNK